MSNQINGSLLIFLTVVITVDILMATGNEFQRVGPVTENALELFFVFIRGTEGLQLFLAEKFKQKV